MKINAVLIGDEIFVNTKTQYLYYEGITVIDDYYSKYGWWIPTPNSLRLEEALTVEENKLEDDWTYISSVIDVSGRIKDVYWAKESGWRVTLHQSTPVRLLYDHSDSSELAFTIETLSVRKDLDNVGKGKWSIERVEEILSHFKANNNFKRWCTLPELVEELKKRDCKPLPFNP